jgi:hypothetical protein
MNTPCGALHPFATGAFTAAACISRRAVGAITQPGRCFSSTVDDWELWEKRGSKFFGGKKIALTGSEMSLGQPNDGPDQVLCSSTVQCSTVQHR